LAVRIGISVGDAVVDDGDLHGTAVVEAARLCAVARSRTILCSEADAACRLAGRNLTRTEWETRLADLGEYRATCPEFPLETNRSAAARPADR
jgi:class 3 adenylate cyclase